MIYNWCRLGSNYYAVFRPRKEVGNVDPQSFEYLSAHIAIYCPVIHVHGDILLGSGTSLYPMFIGGYANDVSNKLPSGLRNARLCVNQA